MAVLAPPTNRPYQDEALAEVLAHRIRGVNRQLISLATGLGKTVILAQIPRLVKLKNNDVTLILAHRKELIDQAVAKVKDREPHAFVQIEKAEQYASPVRPIYLKDDGPFVVVGSIQTMQGKRLTDFLKRFKSRVAVLIIDEAHHAVMDSYMKLIARIMERREDVLLVGVTATPQRGDNVGLDAVFDQVVYHRDIKWAIKEGWLVPVTCWRIRTKTTLDGVGESAGDFNVGALSDAINNELRNNDIVSAYQTHTPNKKFLVFCPTVAHAKELTRVFNEAGVLCDVVTGNTPADERADMFHRMKVGKLLGLASVGVTVEGYDEPSIEVIITATPTRSRGRYTQIIGRGLRPLGSIAGELLGEPEMTNKQRRALIAACAKPGCTILEVFDKGSKSVVTFPSLWGLPAKMDLQGKDVEKVAEAFEELASKDTEAVEKIEAMAAVDTVEQVELFKWIETELEKVDLFETPFGEEQVAEIAQLAWAKVGDTFWLNLPAKTIAMDREGNLIPDFEKKFKKQVAFYDRAKAQPTSLDHNADSHALALASLNVEPGSVIETREHLQIIPDLLNKQFQVIRKDLAQTIVLGTVPSFQEALERAEAWVAHNRPLIHEKDGDDPWRARKPHPSQIAFLEKHHFPLSEEILRSQGAADLAMKFVVADLEKAAKLKAKMPA